MKILAVVLIIILFGCIGYFYRNKLINKHLFLKYISSFYEYYLSNVILFQNSLVEIIDNYIIMHKNKNANYNKLFLKNNNIYVYNREFLESEINNKEETNIIYTYLSGLGKNNFELEKDKIISVKNYLDEKVKKVETEIKTKGELYFKIMLSIGAIISILIWWYMDVSVLFKIGAIGILTTVIAQLFQHQGRNDLATLTGLAGLVIVLFIVLGMVSDLFSTIKTLFDIF